MACVYRGIPLVLGLGVVAGLITATPVAKLGIPSFVASLAGWLIYRGLIGVVTAGTGTIIISDKIYNAIGNGFIPDIPTWIISCRDIHKLTILLGLVGDRPCTSAAHSSAGARNRPITSKCCR